MEKCGINNMLILLLVSLLAFGQMPFMTFAACDAISDSVMQEQDDILPDENDTNTTDGADGEDKNSELPDSEADDVGEVEATGEINNKDDLTLTCSGSISGMLWHDENSDGTWDEVESGIANYPVSLYKADDRSNAVQTVTTDTGGKYAFVNIESGIYIVGVKSNELGADYYMLPMEGVTGDNKFGTWSSSRNEKHSDFITIEMNTTVTDMDAGLRMSPVAQATSTTATVIGTEITLDGLAAGGMQMEIEGILIDNSYPAIIIPDDITKLTVIGAMNRVDLNYIWQGSYDIHMSGGKMNGITTLDLSGVTLEEMTGFPDYQFAYNTVLQTVTLPTGLGYLGDYTFESCTSLTNVDLSGCMGMSYVGEGTFTDCKNLTSVILSGIPRVVAISGSGSYDTFEGTNSVKVIVPYVLLTSYQRDSNWSHNVSAYNVKLLADQTKPEDFTDNDKINNNKNHNNGDPSGTGKQVTLTANKGIKTGDSSNLWLWVVLTITGLGVLVVMGCRKRGVFGKKKNKRFLH